MTNILLDLRYNFPSGVSEQNLFSYTTTLPDTAEEWVKSRVWYDHATGNLNARLVVTLPNKNSPQPFSYFGRDIFHPGNIGLFQIPIDCRKQIFLWLCHITGVAV